jgi:hypothetical protein
MVGGPASKNQRTYGLFCKKGRVTAALIGTLRLTLRLGLIWTAGSGSDIQAASAAGQRRTEGGELTGGRAAPRRSCPGWNVRPQFFNVVWPWT